MLFNSIDFLVFFPVVTLVYFVIPFKARWVWLLLASYYFYMSWNPTYALLIGLSTLLTYLCGLLLGQANEIADEVRRKRRKRLWLVLSLAINLAILFFFKYFDFALDNVGAVFSLIGISFRRPAFDVLLPVGISFYTFQALGYTIDVYRGDIEAEKSLGYYALFVSFFPQLVAGPIERSGNLIGQLHQKHSFEPARVRDGLVIMLWGFFEKLVVADRAAILVDRVFGEHTEYAGLEFAIAALLFAFQIYGDFSGYSHIAIGAAKVMGFDLMTNFRQPYFAASIREFWQRWHISLSSWFRDYVYIPLGGNRKGRPRKYFNTMVTFLVSGLWHGASWNYVVWGGLHGAYQVTGDLLTPARKGLRRLDERSKPFKYLHKAVQVMFTFILVDVAWVFFRGPGITATLQILRSMLGFALPSEGFFLSAGLEQREVIVLILGIALLLLADLFMYHKSALAVLRRQKGPVRWLFYYLMLYIVVRYGVFGSGYAPSSFLYFQF